METDGIMLPLSSLSTKFVLPARYDDVLRVRVLVKSLPSVRFLFEYEVYNQAGLLVATGDTTLVFVDATTRRPCRPPQEFMAVFSPFFDKSE
jgi:acyl-CoA thioester hydrolase